jgi:ribulose-bisphosphate carboxylase small chain
MITQGQFSFLPPLTDAQIAAQIAYALGNGWAVSIEHTDDPHPRNTYWEMFGMPMFDLKDPAAALGELDACRRTFPEHYIRVMAFDSTRGWETPRMAFIVNRPQDEPRFRLQREEAEGRTLRYTVRT